FYTPHEVSFLMSEIIANHLKDRKKIEIYDPTSGSGSLLITIGKSVAKHTDSRDNIKYYAQEWKENTYNLTRMNLVMRGILPDNIVTRNGDTLEDDWPYFDENDPNRTYRPLYVDAVVSNPPYSIPWDPSNKENDARFSRFGLAPKGKADYAFLLHDLYHLKPDGMMAIVLPHGVLFRGGEEEKIRTNLVEQNHVDTIIGLPANIFFGTSIPTIIMILRQKRPNSDVLFIDASKGFFKEGKNNRLLASHIKRIVDTVVARADVCKFSRVVAKDEIRNNEYNLNIPRYVDSSDDVETWDIYATMNGGIPNAEIDLLNRYWSVFPRLRKVLFRSDETPYSSLAVDEIKDTIVKHKSVQSFTAAFSAAFEGFDVSLESELIGKMTTLNVSGEETVICDDIFARLSSIPLVDKYRAFQILDDQWRGISADLEIIQTEGFDAVRQVDPNMVIKKKNGRDEEVQEGWVGHVIPFELAQATFLQTEYEQIREKEGRLDKIASEYEEIIESFSEEEKDGDYLNDDNTAFVAKEVARKLGEVYAEVESEELAELTGYLELFDEKAGKAAKLRYIAEHSKVDWAAMENTGGVYAKGKVNERVALLRNAHTFPEDSFEAHLVRVARLMDEEKELKRVVKTEAADLHVRTKEMIGNLTNAQAKTLLKAKWIEPLTSLLLELPSGIVNELVKAVRHLSEKYAVTYLEIDSRISETERELAEMIDQLEGDDYDMMGLAELKALFSPEPEGK
ncbi:MAG: type I restriction-modification system subunit M, partial [Thermoguttaceae bacterium]|nr:type I restriction-modification system subunit M [Thermoguttaceae bacterium]